MPPLLHPHSEHPSYALHKECCMPRSSGAVGQGTTTAAARMTTANRPPGQQARWAPPRGRLPGDSSPVRLVLLRWVLQTKPAPATPLQMQSSPATPPGSPAASALLSQKNCCLSRPSPASTHHKRSHTRFPLPP